MHPHHTGCKDYIPGTILEQGGAFSGLGRGDVLAAALHPQGNTTSAKPRKTTVSPQGELPASVGVRRPRPAPSTASTTDAGQGEGLP